MDVSNISSYPGRNLLVSEGRTLKAEILTYIPDTMSAQFRKDETFPSKHPLGFLGAAGHAPKSNHP